MNHSVPGPDDPTPLHVAGGWAPPTAGRPDQPVPGTNLVLPEVRPIGTGGMGSVWMAVPLDGAVAPVGSNNGLVIKFIHPHLLRDTPGLAEQFASEAHRGTLNQSEHLAHAWVVRDLRGEPDWNTIAIVMPRYGPSFKALLEDVRRSGLTFDAAQVCHLMRQILLGIERLHRDGLVHRDLKPDNILVDLRAGELYDRVNPLANWPIHMCVSDFGMVQRVGDVAVPLGRNRYRLPSMYDGADRPVQNHAVSFAEDVHSLGVILVELLDAATGTPPAFRQLADNWTADDAAIRPERVASSMILRISRDYSLATELEAGGFRPQDHAWFVGRTSSLDSIRTEIEARQADRTKGGFIAVIGPAGVGKTALLVRASRRPDRADSAVHGDECIAWYFRERESRTSPRDMIDGLIRMVRKRFGIGEQEVPATRDRPEEEFMAVLRAAAGKSPSEPIAIVVDGLDESSDPAEALRLLPVVPPGGTCFLVSSRPHAGLPHDNQVPRLTSRATLRLSLDPKSKDNLDDIAIFLRQQLPGLSLDEASNLAGASAGIFRIAVVFAKLLGASPPQATVADLVDSRVRLDQVEEGEKLMFWYGETWNRILRTCTDAENLEELLGFLMAARSPLTESQVTAWTGWTEIRLDSIRNRLAWLVEREIVSDGEGTGVALLYLSHQSARDYLGSVRHGGPLRNADRLRQFHSRIARHYLAMAARIGWQNVDPYGRFHAVRHMIESGEAGLLNAAESCLSDFRYLYATLGDATPGKGA